MKLIVHALVIAGAVLVIAHVASAETSKDNPPAACQLSGGHWDIWNGWRCAG